MSKSSCCCPVSKVSFWLIVIGAINWGLVGLASFNLVDYLAVDLLKMPIVGVIIYALVGFAGLFLGIKKLMCCGKSCKK